jgi:hypothetical protein
MMKAGFEPLQALSLLRRQMETFDSASWVSTYPELLRRYDRLFLLCEQEKVLAEAVVGKTMKLEWMDDAIRMSEEKAHVETVKTVADPDGIVLFVPGISILKKENPATYASSLGQAYPRHELRVMAWECSDLLRPRDVAKGVYKSEVWGQLRQYWPIAKLRADTITLRVVNEIVFRMSPEERAKLILAGHSLGVRVILRVTQELAARGMQLHQIVLMGGAVPADTPLLENCAAVSAIPPQNYYHWHDEALSEFFYSMENVPALGLTGLRKPLSRFQDYQIPGGSQLFGHAAALYLKSVELASRGELAPQDTKIDHFSIATPLPMKVWKAAAEKVSFQKTGILLEQCFGWEFIVFKNWIRPNEYLIRNPYRQPVARGRENAMRARWKEICGKLDAASRGETGKPPLEKKSR